MSERARAAIMKRDCMDKIHSIDRAPRLVERIKIETKWLLLTTPDAAPAIEGGARRNFIEHWPAIRNARLPADEVGRRFYDIAAERAATLAALIIWRRNKKWGTLQ
jgi:hypothetical protein